MLAKQDTPIKASKTLLGCVPAKLSTRVIKIRSILVLLKADEIVKPPMSNMIVGENMAEKTNLREKFSVKLFFLKTLGLLGSGWRIHLNTLVVEDDSEQHQK